MATTGPVLPLFSVPETGREARLLLEAAGVVEHRAFGLLCSLLSCVDPGLHNRHAVLCIPEFFLRRGQATLKLMSIEARPLRFCLEGVAFLACLAQRAFGALNRIAGIAHSNAASPLAT